MTDPFSAPSPIQSNFASVQSFRGRLVLIEPTKVEMVPNQETGALQERITATISVLDGSGPVSVFSYGEDTGRKLEGSTFKGVWIGQEILIGQLKDPKTGQLMPMTLGRFETKTPGLKAKKGNPWGILPPTAEDMDTARAYLATRFQAQAAAALPSTTPQEQVTEAATNPFAEQAPF